MAVQVQGEEFQAFKKKCQEDVEAQKAQNVKSIEEARTAAASKIAELDQKQFKEEEHHRAIEVSDFKTQQQDKNEEDIKKKIKERKHADKKELEAVDFLFSDCLSPPIISHGFALNQMNEGEVLMSEVDEEILKQKQKEERKALKKQLKRDFTTKLKDDVRQQEQDFALKQLTDVFQLRSQLMAEV